MVIQWCYWCRKARLKMQTDPLAWRDRITQRANIYHMDWSFLFLGGGATYPTVSCLIPLSKRVDRVQLRRCMHGHAPLRSFIGLQFSLYSDRVASGQSPELNLSLRLYLSMNGPVCTPQNGECEGKVHTRVATLTVRHLCLSAVETDMINKCLYEWKLERMSTLLLCSYAHLLVI